MPKYGSLYFFVVAALLMIGCSGQNDYQPALIPMQQEIIWNNEQYDLAGSSLTIVRRIIEYLPGVKLNRQEAYILVVTNYSAILSALTTTGLPHGMKTPDAP